MALVLLAEWREAGMGRAVSLVDGCVGVSGVARVLLGWVQSKDGGTETRQGESMTL